MINSKAAPVSTPKLPFRERLVPVRGLPAESRLLPGLPAALHLSAGA
jgi:hypothetical protein